MTRIGGVPKAPDTFLRGAVLAPLWLRGAVLAPLTDRHDTQMTRIDTHVFRDFPKTYHGRNAKTQEKKVEPGQNRKDWRTPWRIISIAFTSPQRKDLLGQCCPVNKAPCIAWRKATPRCKPDEIMKKCMNTYKYPAICSFGTLKIKGCRFVTPLKGYRFETRLVVLVYIHMYIYIHTHAH